MAERKSGLDIIRALAVFFVVAIHFFIYTGFYEQPMYGETLYIQTGIRWLLFTCVPLFIILTGYLKCNKKLDKNHYKTITHVLISYIFASICVILFKKLYLHSETSMTELVLGIFNFTTDSYAWYIEMYIGLFLLIPFLNIIYNNLEEKKNKQLLVLTMLFLTSFSTIGRNIELLEYEIFNIFPDWWSGTLYPVTYYFIGCYLREYQLTLPKIKNILYIILILFIQTTLFYYLSYGRLFDVNIWGSYGNIFTAVLSILIFVLFYKVDIKNIKINSIIKNISILSLDIYLLSNITDNFLYRIITPQVEDYRLYLLLFFVIVPLNFVLSYLLAFIKKITIDIMTFFYKKIKKSR